MEKGAIVDVYPEGEGIYRGCVLEPENDQGLVYVVDLDRGTKCFRCMNELAQTTITNIFTHE